MFSSSLRLATFKQEQGAGERFNFLADRDEIAWKQLAIYENREACPRSSLADRK
jgi:hypothetical protein